MLALRELLQECGIGDTAEDTTAIAGESTSWESESALAAPTAVETVPDVSRHRALVFCQWKASIDMVAGYLVSTDKSGSEHESCRKTAVSALTFNMHVSMAR